MVSKSRSNSFLELIDVFDVYYLASAPNCKLFLESKQNRLRLPIFCCELEKRNAKRWKRITKEVEAVPEPARFGRFGQRFLNPIGYHT